MSIWMKSTSHYKVPAALILASLGAIFGMGYLQGGEQAAEGVLNFSLRQIGYQFPVGLLVIFVASRLIEFDFGTIVTISLKILAISSVCLAISVAMFVFAGQPESSLVTAALNFVTFLFLVMILFGTSGLETWLIAALSIAVPYALNHYIVPAVQAQLQEKPPAASAPARTRGNRR
jgi:hypothetical protein